MIPKSYIPATWRNTLPMESESGAIGIGFNTESGDVIRLKLDEKSARDLIQTIRESFLAEVDKQLQQTKALNDAMDKNRNPFKVSAENLQPELEKIFSEIMRITRKDSSMKNKLLFGLEVGEDSIGLNLLGKTSVTLDPANACLLSKQLMHYVETFPSPGWGEFLNEIFEDSRDRITGLQREFLKSEEARAIIRGQILKIAEEHAFSFLSGDETS